MGEGGGIKSKAKSREGKGGEWTRSDEYVKQMENKSTSKEKNNRVNTSCFR